MKTSKIIFNYALLILIILLLGLAGCTTEPASRMEPQPANRTVKVNWGNSIEIMTIEAHEYISWRNALTHNENCPNKYHIYNKPE